jgi:hypothetical protein
MHHSEFTYLYSFWGGTGGIFTTDPAKNTTLSHWIPIGQSSKFPAKMDAIGATSQHRDRNKRDRTLTGAVPRSSSTEIYHNLLHGTGGNFQKAIATQKSVLLCKHDNTGPGVNLQNCLDGNWFGCGQPNWDRSKARTHHLFV